MSERFFGSTLHLSFVVEESAPVPEHFFGLTLHSSFVVEVGYQ